VLGRSSSLIVGKVGYAVMCAAAAVVLVVSGVAHNFVDQVTGFGGGISLNSGASVGEMNILVMGLESRTNYYGQTLSAGLLAAMHAGSVDGVNNQGVGGQATNTLILIHIFAGGQKAVGYSIPRDDWVTYPQAYDGQSAGKIDQAYGLAYAQSLQETVSDKSLSSKDRYTLANQAGQKATIATVEAVTGQSIDHFAEVNLAGFYYLAQAFNGIEACIKPSSGGTNLTDANSGFNAYGDGYNRAKGGTQYLHLSAPQALAFVRERDNLPNGDLDRTHRQQAVLDYVIYKLEHENLLSNIGDLEALLGHAKSYLVTDTRFNPFEFATKMKALTGKNLHFYTAPITGFPVIDGQSTNSIDLPAVQKFIQDKFTPAGPAAKPSGTATEGPGAAAVKLPPASSVTVDVYNGGTAQGLATGISAALVGQGYTAGMVTNASVQSKPAALGTQVFYGAGASANAARIAGYFGATAAPLTTLAAGHVEVLTGTGTTTVPSALAAASATPSAASAPASAPGSVAPTTAGDNGAAGGAVNVGANAKDGVPCVY
jgi:LCP family protein required for cell wall assembly